MALGGKVWVYTGDSMSSYVTKYQEDEECMAHDFYEQIETDFLVCCITLRYATLRDNDAPNNTITTTIIIYDRGRRRHRHPVVPREILERNI
jgi:hypothetical protein